MRRYDIKDYPINCFDLLDRIISSGTINLDKMESGNFTDGLDAAAEYYGSEYGYCIVVNSKKKGTFRYSHNRRCNFTIAHELGHIFLEHLLIPRRLKTKIHEEYENLEADEFAGRLLMPENLILRTNFISAEIVSYEFLVSRQALFKRVNNLKRLDLYKIPTIMTCKRCGNTNISLMAEYCNICGAEVNSTSIRGVKRILYNPVESDVDCRILTCPVCRNNEMSGDARHCRICGTPLHNECNSEKKHYNCYHINEANARYCEMCGHRTLFYDRGFLTDWKIEKQQYVKTLVCK